MTNPQRIAGRKVRAFAATALFGALATTGLSVPTASATPVIPEPPIRQWQFSEYRPEGEVVVAEGSKVAGELSKRHDFGPATFPDGVGGKAIGAVYSSRRGDRYWVQTQAADGIGGNKAALTQLQAFKKVDAAAEFGFSIKQAIVDAVDFNGSQLTPGECADPSGEDCPAPIDAMLFLEVAAYNSQELLFRTAGTAFVTGWAGHWDVLAWSEGVLSDPLWRPEDFTPYIDDGTRFAVALDHRLNFDVDLARVGIDEAFTLRSRASVSVMNRRGRESGLVANLIDPRHVGGIELRGAGLVPAPDPLAEPPEEEPAVDPTCDPDPDPAAGTLQLSSAAYPMAEFAGDGRQVVVTRTGGSVGEVSATLTAVGGTATADVDFTPVSTTITFADGDTSPRGVRVPITQDQDGEPDETVQLTLSEPRCAALGDPSAAELTIVDDDRPVEPGPAYTVGGTVTGLEGSGLELQNLGEQLPVSNGAFAFPTPVPTGIPYDVTVATQPTEPAQICTVSDGTGTVAEADVTNVAVACSTPAPTGGLDPDFGTDGLATDPVNGRGARALALQPDGRIVAVGEFSLARYTADGELDNTFAGDGTTTTGLSSGFLDAASDVAVQPDGKVVVVGIADEASEDFGVERYDENGLPDESFDTDGRVSTDLSGSTDRAYGVALQPDGKIVVAGHAEDAAGTGSDFAVVRYLPSGRPDPDFGTDGVVTTDVAGVADFAHAVALQDDGSIVVVGRATDDGSGQALGVVRYTPAGVPDPTFGTDGIGDPFNAFSGQGVTVQPDGAIIVAGDAFGDFAVARFLPNGILDPAFDTDGVVTTDFGVLVGGRPGAEYGKDLALQPDGRIVVIGISELDRDADLAMARYEPNGTLDATFGSDGKLSVDFFGSFDSGFDVAIQPDAKIVGVGTAANGNASDFGLVRVR